MIRDHDWDQLLALLYDSAGSLNEWGKFAAELQRLSNAYAVTLSTKEHFDAAPHCDLLGAANSVRENWFERYQFLNPYADPVVLSRLQAGRVQWLDAILPSRAVHGTEFETDFTTPSGFDPNALVLPLKMEQQSFRAVGLLVGRGGGNRDERSFQLLERLRPHFSSWSRLQDKLTRSQGIQESMTEALDHFPTGVAVFNKRGQIETENAAFRRILRSRDGLKLVQSRLVADSPAESRMLNQAINGTEHDFGQQVQVESLRISRPSGSSYFVSILPLPPKHRVSGASLVGLLFISDPTFSGVVSPHALRELFQLTPQESKVAASIARGSNINEVASDLKLTRETIKGYLKHVFLKTGASSQTELVRMLVPLGN